MRTLHSILRICLAVNGFSVTTMALAVDDSQFIQFSGDHLITGRQLWIENCKGCHAYGTAGAPIPMMADAWQARVVKDKAVLYDHAINGFFGPDYTMMPERGGNPNLSDEQVMMAVDYMVVLAKHYIEKQSNELTGSN
ncbi:MAG: cytochrome c5 family protein [Gammaproteobacteria bacterium]|nr:MAG: cytochrome c5 family protein [Gammaproteobacteria bacterium]